MLVDGQQALQQAQAVKAGLPALAQMQEAHRPEQRDLGAGRQRDGLVHLGQQAIGMQAELRGLVELGHQVVVVGVEPLGHLQRLLALA